MPDRRRGPGIGRVSVLLPIVRARLVADPRQPAEVEALAGSDHGDVCQAGLALVDRGRGRLGIAGFGSSADGGSKSLPILTEAYSLPLALCAVYTVTWAASSGTRRATAARMASGPWVSTRSTKGVDDAWALREGGAGSVARGTESYGVACDPVPEYEAASPLVAGSEELGELFCECPGRPWLLDCTAPGGQTRAREVIGLGGFGPCQHRAEVRTVLGGEPLCLAQARAERRLQRHGHDSGTGRGARRQPRSLDRARCGPNELGDLIYPGAPPAPDVTSGARDRART